MPVAARAEASVQVAPRATLNRTYRSQSPGRRQRVFVAATPEPEPGMFSERIVRAIAAKVELVEVWTI